MTKINRLRSFVNLGPRHALLTIYKTNILSVFDYGSIIYNKCSDNDNRMLDKAQLSAVKIILGSLKTTSSNDVLVDPNLTSLNLRRKISLLCYAAKLIFDMVPYPFPSSSFRSFKEFVPYAFRRNQNVQIQLKKNPCPITSSSVRLPAHGTLYHWKSNLQPATPSSWII